MKIRVREAKLRDKGLFRKLWSQLLEDQYEKGSQVLPSENNLDIYEVIFEKYVSGEFPGVVLFVAEDAVLMWGHTGQEALETKDKIATGWGTYVGPKLRGKGASKELRKVACEKLKELGFEIVMGTTLTGNEEGEVSTEKFGFKKQACVVCYSLKES